MMGLGVVGSAHVEAAVGGAWTEIIGAGSRYWRSCDMSADGVKRVAVDSGGYPYYSADSGGSWVAITNEGAHAWNGVSMDAAGELFIAIVFGEYAYISTFWGNEPLLLGHYLPARNWSSCAMRGYAYTSQGVDTYATAIATVNSGYIYQYDGGGTINAKTAPGSQPWTCCDTFRGPGGGTFRIAGVDGGLLYLCSYYGMAGGAYVDGPWVALTAAGAHAWRDVVIRDDGSAVHILATDRYGNVHFTHDGGSTWTMINVYVLDGDYLSEFHCSMSNDGSKMLVCASYLQILGKLLYESADFGATWMPIVSAGVREWADVCMSADGLQKMAVAYGDRIFKN